MTVDNFETMRKHLTFESDFDRYIVHVIKRAKDESGKKYGVNETNRLLKTFYITSLEYFDRKIPVIKDLCETNNARAYILPQVRNNEDCLKELLKIVVDNLSNPTIKPDHLVRSAFCGHHGSRDKKWILDLDNDNMVEFVQKGNETVENKWSVESVLDLVRKSLVEIGKSEDEAYLIPTKNGHCLVTSPFNLQKAEKKCSMLFQGDKHIQSGVEWTGPDECRMKYRKATGWLIKDGMALLYLKTAE